MLRKLAMLFGIVFLAVGVLGFVPAANPNGHLLGIFHVNMAHNLVHLLSGLVALMAAFTSEHASRLYFRWFGWIYGLVAVLGLVYGERPLFGIIANNMADVVLHFAIAAVSLIIGYTVRERETKLVGAV